ncbi:YhaN family protein [Sulfitobacter sabulilitoris]|uniref:YhaN AAA domain-containing protein n=1 Tax=Sulfitobacter sabulilitoris TaxID=2562655 RepID=A0A5S3PNF1_9RHOB|nr:YhaN family protein [Sulfitobacter sabulilitoris]TMM54035.1 hypothetical protein FDT80_00040 [Sulfitobacter sabulilitoris]
MRLRRLTLDRFGHFNGKSYDFGDGTGQCDFHVIYGPNEAGKTTSMEAFLRLLYGFAHREPYDFQHQRKNLQVSGLLQIDGADRHFTRLPQRSGSLLDDHGTPLPESALQAHLGGLSLGDYRNLLCLDDETIEKGGEEIASSRGDIGRLLFSAAAGVSDLTAVLDQVAGQADALYRKRASTTEMAQLKKELAEIDRQIRDLDVPASAYRKLKQAVQDTQAEEDALRAGRDRLRSREAGTRAQRAALPMLSQIATLEQKVAPLDHYPARLDVNPEDLVRLLTEQTRAQANADRLADEIEQLRAARGQIALHPEQARLANDLEAVDTLRIRFISADLDLARRRQAVQDATRDMGREASALDLPEEADPRRLVLSPAQIEQIEAARDAMRAAARDRATEHDEVAALTEQHAQAEAELATIRKAAGPQAGIGEILTRFAADRILPDHAAARNDIENAAAQRRDALDALAIKGQRFDDLPACPVTLLEAQALVDEHAALTQGIARTRDALAQHREDAAVDDTRIARMASDLGQIGDAEADALTAERDRAWAAHLSTLTRDSAAPVAEAMARVDALAKARLAQARELGQLRHIQHTREQTGARTDAAEATLRGQLASREAVEARIAAACRDCGLTAPLSAPDLLGWVTRHTTAATADTRLARIRQRHAPLLDTVQRLADALRPRVALDAPAFDALIATARDLALAERDHETSLGDARKAVADRAADLSRRRLRLAALTQAATQAAEAWTALVAEALSGAVDAATLDASLKPLSVLRELDATRTTAARQVSTMEADQAAFVDRMAALAAAHQVPQDAHPLDTHATLSGIAEQARQAQDRHDRLTRDIEDGDAKLALARETLEDIARQVRDIGALFPDTVATATVADLRTAVATAREAIDGRTRLADLTAQVLNVLSVGSLTAARAALDTATAADLEAAAATIDDELETVQTRLDQAIEARTTARREMDGVTGDWDVARLTQRRATLELQLEDAALGYLELRFGLRLAEEAIRRYRDAHRSGMMQATEQAFAELTNGAYTQLRTQPDGTSEMLLAVDAAGVAKQAQDLSKGTRFQLYLALRAAAYTQLAQQGVRLPFFCDDIFETFDEDRTRAACRVMERIGQSGQAIYLTHHRHVVDIAREVCTTEPVVHEIV